MSQAAKSVGFSCNNIFTFNWGSTFCYQIMNSILKRFFGREMFNRSSAAEESRPFIYFMASKNWRQSHTEPDPTDNSGTSACSPAAGTLDLHPLHYFNVQGLSGVKRQRKESTDGLTVNRK